MSDWISVKDGLPPLIINGKSEWYLTYDGNSFEISRYLCDGEWEDKDFYPITPTHWMPLPESPK